MATRGGGGRGGKEAGEEGKAVMGPLFPRLHVSDAVKGGGPRAPPRNKMALYEQFTVPSHRFGGGSLARSASGGGPSPGGGGEGGGGGGGGRGGGEGGGGGGGRRGGR
uniref:Uncharacterized protein n=1 Tax=Oryza brachyantha TaxID=4533 RepID=J3L157_ORYBR